MQQTHSPGGASDASTLSSLSSLWFHNFRRVVRHKANDGVVYAIRLRAWFKYDAALSAVV